jgi:hypothetical protein
MALRMCVFYQNRLMAILKPALNYLCQRVHEVISAAVPFLRCTAPPDRRRVQWKALSRCARCGKNAKALFKSKVLFADYDRSPSGLARILIADCVAK